jgi:hypothetical protein
LQRQAAGASHTNGGLENVSTPEGLGPPVKKTHRELPLLPDP